MQSVLSWQRARVASFLSRSGQQWVGYMGRYNSGTGNNQWMGTYGADSATLPYHTCAVYNGALALYYLHW
jgi:hypothetical protein